MWAKIDDGLAFNAKMRRLSGEAFRLDVISWPYSGSQLSDGHIPQADVALLAAAGRVSEPAKVIAELVESGRWEHVDALCSRCADRYSALQRRLTDGYVIHDWLAYNP